MCGQSILRPQHTQYAQLQVSGLNERRLTLHKKQLPLKHNVYLRGTQEATLRWAHLRFKALAYQGKTVSEFHLCTFIRQ